jgi:UDP-N-acetylglucosamine 4,6-dehydratase/UDP-glucose 4-epimerase
LFLKREIGRKVLVVIKKLSVMLDGKKILITGGTGSLGQALTKRLLKSDVDTIRILSRNESKQVEMNSELDDKRLRFFLGDIRDKERLIKSMEDVDIVFHAAALKHVPIIEYNPFEAIKTNVVGSQNVIDAALVHNVEKVVCIGTDKAVSPLNTYGATKLLMEKLFVSANNYLNIDRYRTQFLAVRYGNVFGSSGSVIPKFLEQIKNNKKITITDENMTRFSITMEEALDFILDCTINGKASEIYVPKLKGYSISLIKDAFQKLFGDIEAETIGIRPGEKLHEVLINQEEIRYCWDLDNKLMISNANLKDEDIINTHNSKIKRSTQTDAYTSENTERLSVSEIQERIKQFEKDQNV